MRHISLMLVGVAAAGISVSPACATVRIISDPGGAVIDYLERFEAVRVSGEPIIIDGACLSACTLAIGLLPRGQVCATPKAVLGFHAAWRPTPNGGRVTSSLGMLTTGPTKKRRAVKRERNATGELSTIRWRTSDLA
jgi:hypothetical protein